jgi:hypothetical protein
LASSNAVVVVTLVGAFAYLVTRLPKTSFCSKFGVEPEEVDELLRDAKSCCGRL